MKGIPSNVVASYGLRISAEYEPGEPLLPLWSYPIEADPPTQSQLPIPPTLRSELEAWNARWNDLANDDHGDDTVEHDWSEWPEALTWNADGYELARRLRIELGNAVEIVYFDYVAEEDVIIS